MPVSERDVAHVRRLFETFDFQWLRSGGLRAWFEEFYDEDTVVEHAEGFPVPGDHHIGRDGYQRWFDDTYGAYDDVRWYLEDIFPVGASIVVVARVAGRPKGDPTELEVRLAIVYRLRAGRICHVRVFLTPELAFQDARR